VVSLSLKFAGQKKRLLNVFPKLEAIKQTKVNVSVYLGNYPDIGDNGTAYQRQRDTIKEAITTYGTNHILGKSRSSPPSERGSHF
jgi:hypothetical protein